MSFYLDHAAVAQFDLSALKILGDTLSSQDQVYLYSSSARAFLTARRRGDDRRVEYWARNPVDKIEINPCVFSFFSMHHSNILQITFCSFAIKT